MSEWASEFDLFDKDKVERMERAGGEVSLVYHDLIKDFTELEMLRLRSEIDRHLPARLGDLNLEQELLQQYVRVKALQDEVLADGDTPANQKAQVAGQVASTLQQLVKMQSEWNTSERLKEIEARLIKALDKVPHEYLEVFFAWYESGETK